MTNSDIYNLAISTYGSEAQEGVAQEECAELIQAISKKHRGKPHNIAEEIADVEIMLEQLKIINDCHKEVKCIKELKLERLLERMYPIQDKKRGDFFMRKDIKLDHYGISKFAYRELKYFCLQYPEKLQELKDLYSLSAVPCSGTHGTTTSNPTASKAERALVLRRDIELIEQSVLEADSSIYQALLRSVTLNIPYEQLDIFCGKRYFCEARRKFYYILERKKEKWVTNVPY